MPLTFPRSAFSPRHLQRLRTAAVRLFLLLATIGVAACATPFRSPPDVAHISLAHVDSPAVRVVKIWLERKGGRLEVTGYAVQRFGAIVDDPTHLDIIFYDAAGGVLRSAEGSLEPWRKQRHFPSTASAAYHIALDPLPAGTARIEVRAHEGTCPAF